MPTTERSLASTTVSQPAARIRSPPTPKNSICSSRRRRAAMSCAPYISPEASPAEIRIRKRVLYGQALVANQLADWICQHHVLRVVLDPTLGAFEIRANIRREVSSPSWLIFSALGCKSRESIAEDRLRKIAKALHRPADPSVLLELLESRGGISRKDAEA